MIGHIDIRMVVYRRIPAKFPVVLSSIRSIYTQLGNLLVYTESQRDEKEVVGREVGKENVSGRVCVLLAIASRIVLSAPVLAGRRCKARSWP